MIQPTPALCEGRAVEGWYRHAERPQRRSARHDVRSEDAAMAFHPRAGMTLAIAGTTYTFAPHPAAPGMPYGQTGRRATVYQMVGPDGAPHALKVFTHAFRTPRLA